MNIFDAIRYLGDNGEGTELKAKGVTIKKLCASILVIPDEFDSALIFDNTAQTMLNLEHSNFRVVNDKEVE